MPFTKEALTTAFNLSEEDVNRTLLASELSLDQPEYSDEEIQTRFERVRCYLKEGQAESYEVAMDLLKQELAAEANGKRKKSSKGKTKPSSDEDAAESNPASREELLRQAQQQIQALMEQVGGLSMEECAQLLPELAHQRQTELIEMFDRGMLKRLNQMVESGELHQMVRQVVGKKSLAEIPSLLEAEVIEEPSLPPLLSDSSNNRSSS
jgi:hypothetical protein